MRLESDCYQMTLEAGHFDFDLLAILSSDEEEIVADELAIVHNDLSIHNIWPTRP